jgi:hypothetical protein
MMQGGLVDNQRAIDAVSQVNFDDSVWILLSRPVSHIWFYNSFVSASIAPWISGMALALTHSQKTVY